MINIFIRGGAWGVVPLDRNNGRFRRFVSVHIGVGRTGRLTLRFMVRLIGRGGRAVPGQVLCIIPQLNSIPIIVILSFNLTLPLIDIVGWPFQLFFSLHDHVCETNTFLLLPLVALRIVLSGVIKRLIIFVIRRSRSLLFLLLVIYLRKEGGFGRTEGCIDLAMDFVKVSSCVRYFVPLTSTIELCICRCITHVSNRDIRKFIFLSFCEAQVLINFVVNRSDFRFSIQENVG